MCGDIRKSKSYKAGVVAAKAGQSASSVYQSGVRDYDLWGHGYRDFKESQTATYKRGHKAALAGATLNDAPDGRNFNLWLAGWSDGRYEKKYGHARFAK